MAAAADWTNLHQDLLARIFVLLSCITDRVRFSAMCKHWRSVALQSPSPLPWLLMPSTAVTSCYRILGGFSDPRPSLADYPRGARFCGSFPGGWFVVALEHIRGHALLNLRSGERIQLPDRVLLREQGFTKKCPVFLRVATMSAAPPGGACVVAALTTGATNIAFWRPGMDCWSTTATRLSGKAEDLTFHDGRFCAVNPSGELFRYKVENDLDEDGAIKVQGQELNLLESPEAPSVPGEIVSRYLLPSASGADLLLVKRYVHPKIGTWRFQIFTLIQKRSGLACRRFYRMWGHVLFVGRGCSKAFDTGNNQPGYIYFLDDVYYGGPMSVLQQDHYHSTDTGSFCPLPKSSDRHISRCLPQGPTSDSSPWIWYLQ
ncbi:uncharacterized protein [Lolium perenne]|uniref:uncharacterized protein n=1 Tax=Lolium perenne TaxID=4522 RepID=UPI0021F55A91|nr:uncharacterized protein LOC127330351 [Lolium perenne]